MPINTAVLALVLIFIPGILCYGVVASLASKRTRDNITIFLQIFHVRRHELHGPGAGQ